MLPLAISSPAEALLRYVNNNLPPTMQGACWLCLKCVDRLSCSLIARVRFVTLESVFLAVYPKRLAAPTLKNMVRDRFQSQLGVMLFDVPV